VQKSVPGRNDTSIILGFVNVAARYRSIFIERNSPVESFVFEPDPTKVQNKVDPRQLGGEVGAPERNLEKEA
jgi:hypothetical protein